METVHQYITGVLTFYAECVQYDGTEHSIVFLLNVYCLGIHQVLHNNIFSSKEDEI